MEIAFTELVPVIDASSVGEVRRAAQFAAQRLQFDETRAGELALLATEASRNVLLHGGGGHVVVAGTNEGNGPVAPALKATVPDLTVIAKNNGGTFPVARVRRIITGEGMIASHGSREMPIWGPIFSQVEADVDRGPVRPENLVKYLESIQSLK